MGKLLHNCRGNSVQERQLTWKLQGKYNFEYIPTLLAPPCAVVTKCNSNDRVQTGSSVVQGKETTVKNMWVSTESRKRAALHARPPAMSCQTVK